MGRKNQSTNNGGILKRRGGGDNAGIADWANADCKLLAEFITCITSKGGAVRFGYTRDGGAYSVGVYLGDTRETDYIRPHEDIDDILRDYIASLEDLPNRARPE